VPLNSTLGDSVPGVEFEEAETGRKAQAIEMRRQTAFVAREAPGTQEKPVRWSEPVACPDPVFAARLQVIG